MMWVVLCVCLVFGVVIGFGIAHPADAAEAAKPVPRIEHTGDQFRLLVDGRPYLVLGGQSHNSSALNPAALEPVWQALEALHANTAEIPCYWELVEPQPGEFDFRLVDETIAGARRHGLCLILLWFGSWKNGESHYTPEWVKRDRATYPRVIGPRGEETAILSPLSQAARDADARAFAALLDHIRTFDEADRTVIMVQVENEPGFLGTDRDYSEQATGLFNGPVPPELTAHLGQHRDTLSASMRAAWTQAGARSSGTWTEVFGELAPEAFSAWHVARYVNAVAAAGKKAYSLPMYANAWLVEPGGERAGRWPSGGPTEHVLDVWKAAAPSLDVIAPDIYFPKYFEYCAQYTRPDNPLFVPEANFNPFFAAYPFMTLTTFNGIGFTVFGIDDAAQGGGNPRASEFEISYRVLRPLLPLISQYQYTGKLQAFIQGISQGEDWAHTARVGEKTAATVEYTRTFNPEGARGRGLIIELAPDDFVVAGAAFKMNFRALEGPPRDVQIVSIDEGTYEGDQWVPQRRLNGDERHVSFPDSGRILRVRLLRP